MSNEWKYEKPEWWSENCARRDYERLRSEVERLRPLADMSRQATDENERLRGLLKEVVGDVVQAADWGSLMEKIERELGNEPK